MANIVICPDFFQEYGHWRPVVALGRKLIENGNTVKYFGIPDCADIVNEGDGDFMTVLDKLFPYGYTSLSYERPEERVSRTAQMMSILNGELGGVFTDPEFVPDLLLAGYFISMEALLLHYMYNVNFMITTTWLRHPAEDPALFAVRYFASLPQELSSRIMNEAVAERNDDEELSFDGTLDSIWRFVAPLGQRDNDDENQSPPTEKKKELIFCPEEFDFDYFRHRSKVYYIEPSILTHEDQEDVTEDPPSEKIIYASAGSRVRDYLDGARQMFKQLIDMMDESSMSDFHLNLVVGHSLQQEIGYYAASKNNDRITVDDWSEQTVSLQHADIAFIHGGLASIKECIYWKVPFVVIPLGKDQKENAVRVRKAKIGAVTDIDSLNVQRLINAKENAQDSLVVERLGILSDEFKAIEENQPGVARVESELPPE